MHNRLKWEKKSENHIKSQNVNRFKHETSKSFCVPFIYFNLENVLLKYSSRESQILKQTEIDERMDIHRTRIHHIFQIEFWVNVETMRLLNIYCCLCIQMRPRQMCQHHRFATHLIDTPFPPVFFFGVLINTFSNDLHLFALEEAKIYLFLPWVSFSTVMAQTPRVFSSLNAI